MPLTCAAVFYAFFVRCASFAAALNTNARFIQKSGAQFLSVGKKKKLCLFFPSVGKKQ